VITLPEPWNHLIAIFLYGGAALVLLLAATLSAGGPKAKYPQNRKGGHHADR